MLSRRQCANAIRALAIDAIERAKSGHPGAPLGMADMAEALWRHVLKHNPANPAWINRDRFVLSNGHASMLLYAVLHLTGYGISMDDIKNFRQWGSCTPGHPERSLTPGVEMTTGPLGQGVSTAVGMALGERLLASTFNRPDYPVIDHFTYAFCGDGCLMEGVSHEACSLAGTWGLGKLTVLYDSNGISIDGKIDPWFSEDVGKRFAAYGWQVLGPLDGHDSKAIDAAIQSARSDLSRPAIIICRTHIGYGSPKEDSASSHGSPLGEGAAESTKASLGWNYEPFFIPAEIYAAWDAREKGRLAEESWNSLFAEYCRAYPQCGRELSRRMAGQLPADWQREKASIIKMASAAVDCMATRSASQKILENLIPVLPELLGGAADLSSSVGTVTSRSVNLDVSGYTGNYVSFGVREFGMSAIMNGLALEGGFIPYAGTFLAFSDQAKNAVRLAAIMSLRVVWAFTHDSIGVGEDGPTHQPVEQLPMLRLTPNLHVWRPCDIVETGFAWISAIECANTPTCLVLSRQKLPHIARDPQQTEDIAKGGYILRDAAAKPRIILLATGSEVHLALDAAEALEKEGIPSRVVSLPCAEIFDAQDAEWREMVLPASVRCRLAIEASAPDYWIKYTGMDGDVIGMDGFGASAPGDVLFEKYGFAVDNIMKKAHDLLARTSPQVAGG